MASTTSTTYASTIQTKWQKQLLATASGMLVADKFANTKVQGKGEGNTIRINRILRPSRVTSASSAGTLIAPASAKALTSNYMDLSMEIWGDSFSFDEDVDIQSFVSDKDNREVIANQMARSLDYQIMKKLATQGMRHRIDADGTYQVSGTADSGSTTTLVDDALTEANDAWNGGYVTITNPDGSNYDQTRLVSDFDAASDTVTHAAFNHAIGTSSKYRMTVGTGVAATDKLTTDGVLAVNALHEKMETQKFPGMLLRCFIDAEQKADLWTDTNFVNTAVYDNSERFGSYSLIRWLDTEFLVSSQVYREDVDGTENAATGVARISPYFGANSHTVVRYGNPGGSGKFGVAFYVVDTPDSQNLRNSAKFLSWKGTYAAGVTRATSVIGLMTGATSLNVVV